MKLKDYLNRKIKAHETPGNYTYEHKFTFQDGSSCNVYCSGPNIVTVNNNNNMNVNGTVMISGNVTIGGSGAGFTCNGSILLKDYPPSSTCGRLVKVQYIRNIGGANDTEVNDLLNLAQQIKAQEDNIKYYNNLGAPRRNDTQRINSENIQIQSRIYNLQSNLISTKAEQLITGFSLLKKSHILTKIWTKTDSDSNNFKNLIIQKKFNANYCPANGIKPLFKISIENNDSVLLKHLIPFPIYNYT